MATDINLVGDGDSVEHRLILVSERLERASSDLQTLVDQLRESFQRSSDESEQDQRDQDQRDAAPDGTDDGTGDSSDEPDGDTPDDPNTPTTT